MNEKITLRPTESKGAEKIVKIIKDGTTPKTAREKISKYHEKDISTALSLLDNDECRRLLHVISPEQLADVIEYSENPVIYFEMLSTRQKCEALTFMEASAAAELLHTQPKETADILLRHLGDEAFESIKLIDSFSPETIGSKMSTDFVAVSDTCDVKTATSELIRQAADNDNISVIYVTDAVGMLCGAIDLKALITARASTPLSEITTVSYPYLYAEALTEDCISLLKSYSEASIPVLDTENRLIGVVTAEDFIDILDDELADDYAKLAGLSEEDDLKEPISHSVKKRLPWLCVLLALGLLVSSAVGLFEGVAARLPIIICFQSLVLDMSGNVGTQSLAVAIRVLADGEISARQKAVLVWREIRIGLINGVLLGLLSFAGIGLYLCLRGSSAATAFSVSASLGISMLLAMTVSSLSGTVIPLFFEKIGIDPAVASGPLITTVNDLVAVVVYYGLACIFLL